MGMATFKNWEKPSLFLLGFILINIYAPGIFGAAISTGWLFLIIVSVPLLFFVETRITNSHLIGITFVLYSLASLAWTENLNIATFFVMQMIALSCIFCFGSGIKDIRLILIGLSVGLGISDIISIMQYYNIQIAFNTFAFPAIIYTLPGMPAGLFVNQNIFCEVSVALLLCLLIFKLWWFIPFTLPGIVLIHSKGAILALAVGIIALIYNYNKKIAFLISLIGLLIFAFEIPRLYELTSTTERIDMWLDIKRGISILGQGIGSFEITYPFYATHIDTMIARPKFAHNDLLQLVYEFGIGSILFVIMTLNIMKVKSDAKPILVGILVLSMFNYSMHVPAIAFIALLVAGFITRNDDTVWDNGIVWRPNLFARNKGT